MKMCSVLSTPPYKLVNIFYRIPELRRPIFDTKKPDVFEQKCQIFPDKQNTTVESNTSCTNHEL